MPSWTKVVLTKATPVLGAPGMAIKRPAWEGGAPDEYVGEAAGFAAAAAAVAAVGVRPRGLGAQIADTAGYLAAGPEKT